MMTMTLHGMHMVNILCVKNETCGCPAREISCRYKNALTGVQFSILLRLRTVPDKMTGTLNFVPVKSLEMMNLCQAVTVTGR